MCIEDTIMRMRIVFFSMAVIGAVALCLTAVVGPAAADQGAVLTATMVVPIGVGDEEHKYLGSKSCRMCHMVWHKSWAETKHAKSPAKTVPKWLRVTWLGTAQHLLDHFAMPLEPVRLPDHWTDGWHWIW